MRRTLSWLAVLLLAVVPAASYAGVPAGEPAQRVITYEVRTRGQVHADVAEFARIAQRTFNDRRGWSLGGSVRFRQVASGGELTLWLASPAEVDAFAGACSRQWSCQVGRHVIINDERWRLGTATWPAVDEYRRYVLNHEMGHWLGLGHRGCPGAGAPAPVMQQQSIALSGCTSRTWPLDSERAEAARHARVAVRSSRPDLYVVAQAGTAGTELHGLDGATDHTTWALHAATALGRTDVGRWLFTVADRDADGVDDLVALDSTGAVRVLDGASGYTADQLRAVTPLGPVTPESWDVDTADVDADGHLDLVAVELAGRSGRTEVHVLDGADGFRTRLVHAVTPLHATTARAWSFATGDHDRDGRADLYALARRGASGRTEVHVLDGRTEYGSSLAHVATALHGVDAGWDLAVGDRDADGHAEVAAVARSGGSGRTEVHVLEDRTYDLFVQHAVTPLGRTAGDPSWHVSWD